jgi:putative transposase
VRYQFIKEQQEHFSQAALCRGMRVSQSGYADWCKRQKSPRQQEEAALVVSLREIHRSSRGTYGSPRIYRECKARGLAYGRNRVARLMRKYQITARPLRRFVVTTDANHDLPVAENRLDRQFTVKAPNCVWSGDITYLWTDEGWLYLAVVLDLFSRRVVGWSFAPTLDRVLVIGALWEALDNRRPAPGLLCHSDRGSQYASADYQALLSEAGIVCSMSRKGNCYDNAPVESFFASLKRELVHRCRFATREEARLAVFEWIAVWYNRQRRHSALGYVSPEQFEQQYHQPETMRRVA